MKGADVIFRLAIRALNEVQKRLGPNPIFFCIRLLGVPRHTRAVCVSGEVMVVPWEGETVVFTCIGQLLATAQQEF